MSEEINNCSDGSFEDMLEIRIAAADIKCQEVIKERYGTTEDQLEALITAYDMLWQTIKFICKRFALDPTELPFYKQFEKNAREIRYRNEIKRASYEFKEACLKCPKGDIKQLKSIELKLPGKLETPKPVLKGVVNEQRRRKPRYKVT